MRRSAIGGAIVAAVIGLGVLTGPGPAAATTPAPNTIGHRGGGGGEYTENTMKAFAAGARAGLWIESDIRFTKDDVPVMMHDPNVDRTTNGRGPVSSFTFAQLRRLRTDDRQPIPTFAQFTNYLKSSRTRAFIEFKQQPGNARQWANVQKLSARVKGSLVVYSKYPAHLAKARAHGLATALYERARSATPATIRAQGGYYLRQYSTITRYEVTMLRQRGVKVVLYTPQTKKGWQKAKDLGAWGVLTDNAAEYAAWRS